jgi:hypothetical protein
VEFSLKFRGQVADETSSGAIEIMHISSQRIFSRLAITLFELAAGVILALCVVGVPAKAYADPGSGAVLWQLFFASIVSIGFHFRKLRFWLAKRWPRR